MTEVVRDASGVVKWAISGRGLVMRATATILATTILAACAGAPPPPPGPPGVVVDEAERQRCEPVAEAAAKTAPAATSGFGGIGATGVIPLDVLILGALLVALPFQLASASSQKGKAEREAYTAAMLTCLAPGIAERTQGPEHRDTVRALDRYAVLLRRVGHVDTAVRIDRQAQAIRSERWPRLEPNPVEFPAAGEVWTTTQRGVRLTHPGARALLVQSVSASNPGWSADLGTCAEPVLPGGACDLLVRFDPAVPGRRLDAELLVTTVTTDELRTALGATGPRFGELRERLKAAPTILVPAGEFRMGSDEAADESPPHRVFLDAYQLDRQLVPAWALARYRERTGTTTSDRDVSPALVHWEEADAFCRWLGKRLATEAEWERAAHGFTLELRGADVTEWVADWYDYSYYATSPYRNPRGPATGNFRQGRGGSSKRLTHRAAAFPESRFGFRCAVTTP